MPARAVVRWIYRTCGCAVRHHCMGDVSLPQFSLLVFHHTDTSICFLFTFVLFLPSKQQVLQVFQFPAPPSVCQTCRSLSFDFSSFITPTLTYKYSIYLSLYRLIINNNSPSFFPHNTKFPGETCRSLNFSF